jgi:DNA-directed RNA polymerase omega subunit
LEDELNMAVSNEAPDSKFAYVVVVSRRARQLMVGARPLVENPHSRKNTRIAEEELRAGTLEYETPENKEEEDGKRRKG